MVNSTVPATAFNTPTASELGDGEAGGGEAGGPAADAGGPQSEPEPAAEPTVATDPAVQAAIAEAVATALTAARAGAETSGSESFEVQFLKERQARLEAEKAQLVAELALEKAKSSSSSAADAESSKGAINSAATRRAREREWDQLTYVPTSNYDSNPYTKPDPRKPLANPERPQPFPLRGDLAYDKLVEQKSGLQYEYSISAPILYYYWAAQEFQKEDLRAVVLDAGASTAEKESFLNAFTNSHNRIFEWLSTRKTA